MVQEEQLFGPLFNFKAIAASVVQACIRSSEAQLTGSTLIELSMLARTIPTCPSITCNEVMSRLRELKEDSLLSLGRELARNKLITAIGILDFCLYEILVFMISIKPDLLDAPKALDGLPKLKPEEDILNYVKRVLRRTSIERRLDLARDLLGVDIPQDLRDELEPLLTKRHDITHHSKYYEAAPHNTTVVMEARPFPEVSFDEAMIASMTSTEICDTILVSAAKSFFSADLGDLRPMNPAVEKFNKKMREQIKTSRAQEPSIEVLTDPEWEALIFQDTFVYVMDRTKTVSIAATGIEGFPMLIGCFKHNLHGKKSYFKIDDSEWNEVGIEKPEFVTRMLEGKNLLVEYYNEFSDGPLFIQLPLAGFAEAWNKAVAIKEAKQFNSTRFKGA